MPTTLTETAAFGASVAVPATGEARTAASVATPFQELTNRSAAARDGLLGLLSGADVLEVPAGGTLTSFTLSLGNIRGVVLTCGDGATRCLADSTISVTEADIEGGGGTLGAVAQWWHVYAYAATTTLAYEISTTAPTADLVWKAGSVGTKRYLGCFPTTGSGAPIALRKCRGRYLYRICDMSANATQVLATGTAGSFTNVDCSAFVPPHARIAEINAYLLPNAGTAGAQMRTDGAASSGVIALSCDANVGVDKTFSIELSSSQILEYRIASGTPTGLYLDVMGFEE